MIVVFVINIADEAGIEGMGSHSYAHKKLDLDLKNRLTSPAKPSIEEPHVLELEELPCQLRYVFLCENNTFPVIVVADLNEEQVRALVELAEGSIPSIEHQQRLNPPMQEGGMTVVANDKNELVLLQPVIGWQWLDKDVNFYFDEECMKVFEYLKEKLILALVVVAPDYSKVLNGKERLKRRLIIWVLLLYEFDFEDKDIQGCKNQVADHLSRLDAEKRGWDELAIDDSFPDEQVLVVTLDLISWYADFANYLVSDIMPEDLTFQKRKKFLL
ncbi:uncharacterized protein LOC129893804 [Solanum dulcamara]|uniref:uncharacterized protein LOC129893804 n=1 Tax=Solanum dulcamara TaxID=45834 RepID=UPI002486432F|nr:uncharacterized protein LOC129893804 [Solanum dulcamara]